MLAFLPVWDTLCTYLFLQKENRTCCSYLNLGTLVVKIPLIYWFGTYWGVTGIAMAFLLTTFLNTIADFAIAHSIIGDFVEHFARDIAKPILFCLIMIGVVYAYKELIGSEGLVNTLVRNRAWRGYVCVTDVVL